MIAMVVVSSLLALVLLASASAKLRRLPPVVESMIHVGVTVKQIPLLAALEIAGAVGLLVGVDAASIGRLAAAGLVLYFLGAVGAHLRVRDGVQELSPAVVLFVVALVTLVLQVRR